MLDEYIKVCYLRLEEVSPTISAHHSVKHQSLIMKFSVLSTSALIAVPYSTLAVPVDTVRERAVCTSPVLRKAWHVASVAEKTACKFGHHTFLSNLYDVSNKC